MKGRQSRGLTARGGTSLEGSLTVYGSAIDIELKSRTLEKAEQGVEVAISTVGEWGGGRLRRPSSWYDLDKSFFALRGTYEIDEGMPDYVVTEVKTHCRRQVTRSRLRHSRAFSNYLTLFH
jgi:hypothetical protein